MKLKSQIKKTGTELKKVQQLFFQLLRNYPDGVISIVDRDHHFIYTGGKLHKLLGAEPTELIGEKIYPHFPESLRSNITDKLKDVFKGDPISDYELPETIAGGIYVMDAFPLPLEDGTIDCAGIIIRSISKLKKKEAELRQSLQKEKDLNELKSRFVTMASHEFRTPLSTVLSSAYLLEKYSCTEDQPKRKKHTERIIASVNILTDILNDFLSVGKIEEGKISVKLIAFNIKEHISAIIGEMKNLQKKGQEVSYSHSGDEMVELDPVILKHIIMNLLSNAIKFSPEGASIEIRSEKKKNLLKLSVKDQGIGIPMEDQRHLFERFHRGSNVTNIQGTGLGLHIVGKYTELLKGKIQCKSELENGTEFNLQFHLINDKNGYSRPVSTENMK